MPRSLDFEADVAIDALREARRQLGDRVDEATFRAWFRESGAMRSFSRAASGEGAARTLADQMVEAFITWRKEDSR